MKNLTVENSQQMHINLRKCVGVVADHPKVLAPGHSPNTDGIHVSASKDVVIRNTIIGTGDDCISIVSDSFNICTENITCGPGHGISIGSLGEGSAKAQVADVFVHGAFLENTQMVSESRLGRAALALLGGSHFKMCKCRMSNIP